jgi:hypothetical protein
LLWRQRIIHRPQFADLLVDFQQIVTELTEAMELFHLPLRFPQSGGGAESFGNGFSIHFAGQTIERTMPRITGLVAPAALVPASSASAGD